MQVTINIDCTPLEARQFMGLPDVQPLQKAMMDEIEAKMRAEMENFTVDKIMNTWLSFAPQNAEWMRSMFSQFASMASGAPSKTGSK